MNCVSIKTCGKVPKVFKKMKQEIQSINQSIRNPRIDINLPRAPEEEERFRGCPYIQSESTVFTLRFNKFTFWCSVGKQYHVYFNTFFNFGVQSAINIVFISHLSSLLIIFDLANHYYCS